MKNTYKILAGLLGLMLAAAQPAGIFAQTGERQAGTEAAQEKEVSALETELPPDWDDPDYVKRQLMESQELQSGYGMEATGEREESEAAEEAKISLSLKSTKNKTKTTRSPYTGNVYTHAAAFADSEVINGIDISQWQNVIDWAKVKKAGVKFAIIRCGYTSLGSSFSTHADRYYERNIQEASKNGIRVGIYYFANSKTEAEAKAEANATISLLSRYRQYITLPVVYDFEAFNGSYRAYGTPKSQITKNALAYMKAMEKAGYQSMYYGSTNWIPQYFESSVTRQYPCWVAQYAARSTYAGPYQVWQYSSTGRVSGISGNVDCDFWYSEDGDMDSDIELPELPEQVEGFKMADNGVRWIALKWKESFDADGYKIYRSDAYDGTYSLVEKITDWETVVWKDTTVEPSHGRQYYYKIIPYVKENGFAYEGEESRVLTASTLPSYKYKLKTMEELNLRSQAGSGYTLLATVPKGTKFTCTNYTFSVFHYKWYKVEYKHKGKTYTGYLAGTLVKRLGTVKP